MKARLTLRMDEDLIRRANDSLYGLAGGVFSSNIGVAPPLLYFRASPDTQNVGALVVAPFSKTPDNVAVAADLADFQIITLGPAPAPANVLRVGGIPARRVYMRFEIPEGIIDSSSIIRASLLLTQRPIPDAPRAQDTMHVQALRVNSSAVVTDLARALLFITIGPDSTKIVPADSAVKAFEVINLIKAWRQTDTSITPRAIALRSVSAAGVRFEIVQRPKSDGTSSAS